MEKKASLIRKFITCTFLVALFACPLMLMSFKKAAVPSTLTINTVVTMKKNKIIATAQETTTKAKMVAVDGRPVRFAGNSQCRNLSVKDIAKLKAACQDAMKDYKAQNPQAVAQAKKKKHHR